MDTERVNILVIDVGGTNIKILDQLHKEAVKFPSGPKMTARQMVAQVLKIVKDWGYTAVTIGYPGPVVDGKPAREPRNLGSGWMRMDFEKAFGRPVKIVNDAGMQAFGSYEGGRMLFLGLGTGLGSAFIVEGVLAPMELAHLPYRHGDTFEDYVGARGLDRLGRKRWRQHVALVAQQLKDALVADYVVLGGGNSRLLKELPADMHLGKNDNAFRGGFRMWQGIETKPRKAKKREVKAQEAQG